MLNKKYKLTKNHVQVTSHHFTLLSMQCFQLIENISKFTERFSMALVLKAYGGTVLMEINSVLCVAFYFYHLCSCFLTAVSTSTELCLLKHYKIIKKKEVKGFHLSRKVRGIYFCGKNKWKMQTM